MGKIIKTIVFCASIFLPVSFAFAAPSITLTSPNGGETFTAGDTTTITWQSENVDNVSLGWGVGPSSLSWIKTNVPNTGSYTWTVDAGNMLPNTSKNIEIKIIGYQTGVGSVTDTSDSMFTVKSAQTDSSSQTTNTPPSSTTGNNTPPVGATGNTDVLATPYTKWPLEVTDTTATLYGVVNPNGNETKVWFNISAPFNVTPPPSTPKVTIPAQVALVEHKATITGLQPGTRYNWNLVAQTSAGTVLGEYMGLTTKPAPEQAVQQPVDITAGVGIPTSLNDSNPVNNTPIQNSTQTTPPTPTTILPTPLVPSVSPLQGSEQTSTGTVQHSSIVVQEGYLTRNIQKGSKGNDVKKVQELMAQDPSIYPEGITSGYFGSLTEVAVKRFQCKYNVVCNGSPASTGYGVVGPKTRAMFESVYGDNGSHDGSMSGNTGTVSPAPSVEELTTKMNELLKQVAALQAQLNSLSAGN